MVQFPKSLGLLHSTSTVRAGGECAQKSVTKDEIMHNYQALSDTLTLIKYRRVTLEHLFIILGLESDQN